MKAAATDNWRQQNIARHQLPRMIFTLTVYRARFNDSYARMRLLNTKQYRYRCTARRASRGVERKPKLIASV